MAMTGEAKHERGPDRIQDFIFARELAEVYLLIDHISERWDKSLAVAFGDAEAEKHIKGICEIAWPPTGTNAEQAMQAATLIMAKSRLNDAAKPASGRSIAFTVLVAGLEEEASAVWPDHARGPCRWSRGLVFWRSAETPQKPANVEGGGHSLPQAPTGGAGNSAPPPAEPASNVPPPTPQGEGKGGGGRNGGDNSPLPPGGIWGGEQPSRISLAKLAYPGLVRRAVHFHRQTLGIIVLLFVWLIATCILSWNIAAGQAILARLDATETARIAILKRIADSEGAAAARKQSFCEWPPPATQRQLDAEFDAELDDNCRNYRNGREDLVSWLAFPWRFMRALPAKEINEQWAAVLVQVLANAMLPLFYGFLGAGVAVVRNIWGKMRDNLLSTRDPILALGQMAQGAVIGACIGLFISPSGAGSLVTLTPSALSFIAGFGVEGVFVMLESLIKRVFNIPELKP